MTIIKHRYKYVDYKGNIEKGKIVKFTREVWNEILTFSDGRAFRLSFINGKNPDEFNSKPVNSDDKAVCVLKPSKKKAHVVNEGEWIGKSDGGKMFSCTPGFVSVHFEIIS